MDFLVENWHPNRGVRRPLVAKAVAISARNIFSRGSEEEGAANRYSLLVILGAAGERPDLVSGKLGGNGRNFYSA